MTTVIQSLIKNIAKNDQTDSTTVMSLIKEDRDTYTLTEIVRAIKAKNIIIVLVKDSKKEGVVDRNLIKVADLTTELILLDTTIKATVIEGVLPEGFGRNADIKLCLEGTGIDQCVVFLSDITILVKDGAVAVLRCQQLPSGLKIGKLE